MSDSEPNWLNEHRVVQDARLFAQTALAFSLRPRTFVREWLNGQRKPMNPLTMVALSSALDATVKSALRAPHDGPRSYWATLGLSVLPYAHYALVGLMVHGLLRFGPRLRRPRPLSTVAMMLYAGSGPYSLTFIVVEFARFLAGVDPHRANFSWNELRAQPAGAVIVVLGLAAVGFLLTSMTASVAELHQRSVTRVLLSLALGFGATALLYGLLHLPAVEGVFQPFTISVSAASQ